MSPADLAARVPTSRQNIENFESGDVQEPRYLPELARVMGYASTDDLRALKPPPVQTSTLASTGEAQTVSYPARTFTPQDYEWEELMSAELAKEFQTVMPDASMAPEIPKGATVIFVTGIEAEPGDYVLTADNQGHVYLREYRQLRPGHWQAHALNPAFLPLDSLRDELRVLAVFDGVRGRKARGTA